ncbi:MAG: PAS domain S-box protein, partial [Syntrophaceae bacterium]|nr:PAS domain S-box protein [Syntrophaceae bacterium]
MENPGSQRKPFPSDAGGPEALFASILEAVPDAVLGIRERIIIFANPAVESVFGWRSDELVGRNTRVLYRSDEEYEEIGQRFYTALQAQRTFGDQYPCRRRDGQDITCHISVSRIGDDLQQKMIVATYRDITQQLYTQRQLNHINEQLDRQVQEKTKQLREVNTRLESEIERGRLDGANLQRSEQEKALILDTMSELVIYVDSDLKINWSNRA